MKSLLKRTVALLFLIGILYLVAEVLHLHWTVWWYDVFLHFISGASVAMAIILFFGNLFDLSKINKTKIIFITLFSTLVIGILWEYFELYIIHTTSLYDMDFYKKDTVSDILADLSGGFFGTLYSFKFLNK